MTQAQMNQEQIVEEINKNLELLHQGISKAYYSFPINSPEADALLEMLQQTETLKHETKKIKSGT